MRHGQVYKLLVVGIAASGAGFGGDGDAAGMLVKLCQYIGSWEFVQSQLGNDLRIAQDADQLVTHGLRRKPVKLACIQRSF